MSAALACVFPVDRISDWLEELERTLQGFDPLPIAAQHAVRSTVDSIARDPATSDAEIAQLNLLLAAYRPGSHDWRHQRRANLPTKRPQHGHRITLAPLAEPLELQARTVTR